MLEEIISVGNINAVKELLDKNERILIFSHKNPDGDAVGSSLALYQCLKNMGKDVSVVLPNAFPDFLSWLPLIADVLLYNEEKDKVDNLVNSAELIFCLDFNTLSRVGDAATILGDCNAVRILLDHHPYPSDEFDIQMSHPEACSTSELAFRLIKALGGIGAVTYEIAQCVYTGMMTDTGAFAYASTRKDIYIIIAELLEKGIDKDKIYRSVFYNYSLSRMRLLGYVMNEKLKVYNKYNASLITLTHDELMRYYAVKGDTEGLVNMPLQIKGMRFSCFLREEQPGKINVSLRSVDDFPCNAVAAKYFNGGGHKNASGGELHCSMKEAVELFVRALQSFKTELCE